MSFMNTSKIKKFKKNREKPVARPRDMNGITQDCDEFYKYLKYISHMDHRPKNILEKVLLPSDLIFI